MSNESKNKAGEETEINFTSIFEYVKSIQGMCGLDGEEANTILYLLEMWDKKKVLPGPKIWELPHSFISKEQRDLG